MAIRQNVMKAAMQSGRTVASFNVNRWRSVDAAEIAKFAGFEWMFLDLEHSTLSEDLAGQMSITALATGVTPIARVGMDQFYQAARLLDAGAQGIVFPHVDTVEQATLAAAATKYPPMGTRSLTSPLAQAEFQRSGDPQSLAQLNAETLTIVMIETRTAVANAAAIAAVPGVDALMIGTSDLTADFGIPGNQGHADIAAAYATVGAACKASGKFFGMGGVYSKELIEKFLKHGVQFLLGGADVSFVMDGAKARREMIAAAGKA
ncbi:aldolase/citrate lyase family protein [Reyranella aquatilis]|uniref:Aldolase/citrate lyase family protein n=1 Tax=Reyranella aquatilis TaxID=2035356 RepID=A0ABS8L272_9HYPH|nr:aldolase/citrate lyase family protein [Reyranella aquatilis]MCC8432437.1 aldolase/citrate lyase family protein [Reyranella aquatilis]